MAKPKQDFGLTNPLAKTEPAPAPADNSDLDTGRILATGVGLTEGELAAIETIAGSHDITRNAVLRFSVRWFIKQYRAGKVDLSGFVKEPKVPRKHLEMP